VVNAAGLPVGSRRRHSHLVGERLFVLEAFCSAAAGLGDLLGLLGGVRSCSAALASASARPLGFCAPSAASAARMFGQPPFSVAATRDSSAAIFSSCSLARLA
jgi:hypothetical protein